jgi:hypothetical protein
LYTSLSNNSLHQDVPIVFGMWSYLSFTTR